MFKKPGFAILIFLVTLLTIGFPSCDGPDYVALTNIHQIDFYDYSTREYLVAPYSTSSDSLGLFISLEWTSFSFYELHGTLTEAWAFQPAEPRMANEIRDIRIYCDKPVYGLDAGENLAPFLTFGFSLDENYSLVEYLAQLPSKGDVGYGLGMIEVFLSPSPAPGAYIFTVEVEDNNGHLFTGTSSTLHWL